MRATRARLVLGGWASVWVALASALATAGCLDDAPDYPPPTQIPPFILSAQVTPPLSEVYVDGIPMRITVPFRSEDVNEDLTAQFFSDLLPGDTEGTFEDSVDVIEASTYDDTGRSVSFSWNNRRELRGCHSLTMVLTYLSNLDRNLPRDESRTARLVWWMDLNDPAPGTVLVRTCPSAN
jgi:hypothetical protein